MCYWHFFSQFHLEKTKTVADINASNTKSQASATICCNLTWYYQCTWKESNQNLLSIAYKKKPKLTSFMLKHYNLLPCNLITHPKEQQKQPHHIKD